MAWLFFNAAVDNDWNTLGNWWLNAGGNVPAASLPTSADTAEIVSGATVSSNSGSVATVDQFTNNGTMTGISINLRVLSNYGTMDNCTITGALPEHSLYNFTTINGGTINGDLVNESGANLSGGTINGNIINYGTILSYSPATSLSVTGTLTNVGFGYAFLDSNYGVVTGAVECHDFSTIAAFHCGSTLDMYDDTATVGNSVVVLGDVTFHDSSMHGGDLFGTGNVYFKDTSSGCYPYPVGWGGIDMILYHGSLNVPAIYQDSATAFRYRGVDPTAMSVLSINNGVYGWPTGASATFEETALLATMADSMGGVSAVTYNIKRGINGSNILGIL